MKKKLLIALAFWAFVQDSQAADKRFLLEKFSQCNNKTEIAYDYKLFLWNKNTRKDVDSVKGRLYTRAGQYVDSNSAFYIARLDNYYFKLDHEEKTATVLDMQKFGKAAGIRMVNDEHKVLFNITEKQIMESQGYYSIDTLNKELYRLKARLKNHPVSYIQVDFRRDNYMISAAYIEMEEKDDQAVPYLNRLMISNVRYTTENRVFDRSRLFSTQGKKIILDKKYSKYKII